MKKNIILSLVILLFFSTQNICVSNDEQSSLVNKPSDVDFRLIEIVGKVISFHKSNPEMINLSLEALLNEKAISKKEYDFLQENNIEYNPPPSAGIYDSLFSYSKRKNEKSSSVVTIDVAVEGTNQTITKSVNISSFGRYLSQWFNFSSNHKSLAIFKDENLYCFTLSFFNNEHWDSQNVLIINFPKSNKDKIRKLKELMQKNKIEYKECIFPSDVHITPLLPSDFSVINTFCTEILEKIFLITPNDIIKLSPYGFRFKKE